MMNETQDEVTTTKMAPDTTFERYKIDNFVPTTAKRVPHEELDYSIYKPSSNQVVFSTTELRLPLWIKALYNRYYEIKGSNNDNTAEIETTWDEQENPKQPTKCDKITIKIKHDNEKVLTISVNISAGRIQVEGRLVKEWGSDEFEHVLAMVNNPDAAAKDEDIDPFLLRITNKKKANLKSTPTVKVESKMVDSPREKTFSMIKSHLADLEADFVIYKENTNSTIKDLKETIEKKDEEITSLKEEILSLKSSDKDKQQTLSDLTIKQLQIEDEISSINKEHKQFQEKNTNLIRSVMRKQDEHESYISASTSCDNAETPTWASMASSTYTVPTSNSFEVLSGNTNDSECDQPNTSTKTKKATEPLKENNPATSKEDPETTQHIPKKVDPQNQHKSINAETIILCDSNGRFIKPELLCPDSSTHYIRCPTLTEAETIIKNTHFINPKCFILHCGTNDLEKLESDQKLISLVEKVSKLITDKHPNCRQIISGLLPRKDILNEKITPINKKLEDILANKAKISFIHHNNIRSDEDLKDKKHLNQKGVKHFAKNLKAAYFQTSPKQNKRRRPSIRPDKVFPQQSYPFGFFNTPSTPNPYSPVYHIPITTSASQPPPGFHQTQSTIQPPQNRPFTPASIQPPNMTFTASPQSQLKANQTERPKENWSSVNKVPTQLFELIKQLYACVNL